MHRQLLLPGLELRGGPVAVDAANGDHAEFHDFLHYVFDLRCLGVVAVYQDGQTPFGGYAGTHVFLLLVEIRAPLPGTAAHRSAWGRADDGEVPAGALECATGRCPAAAVSSAKRKQSHRWSFTTPTACRCEYTIVGPTKRNPRALRSRLTRRDSSVRRGNLAIVAPAADHRLPSDEAPQVSAEAAELLLHGHKGARVGDRRAYLEPVAHDFRIPDQGVLLGSAEIGPRDRPRSRGRRAGSRSACAGMVRQLSPACAPSRIRNSNWRRSSSHTGVPHSRSWYACIGASPAHHGQRFGSPITRRPRRRRSGG